MSVQTVNNPKIRKQFFDKVIEVLEHPLPSCFVRSALPLQVPQFNRDVEYAKVFDAIKNRLSSFNPPILLDEHIVHSQKKLEKIGDYLPVKTYRNILNGDWELM